MEEATKDKVPSIEDHPTLKDYEDAFREILWLEPKRERYFSINLIPRATLVSKTPYRMSTP
jgi:hypothetical protein